MILQPGTDEAAFLSNEAAGMQVLNNFDLWDGIICMSLTDEESAQLNESDLVIECLPEKPVTEMVAYPPSTPRYELPSSGTAQYLTRYTPSSPGLDDGANYTGMNMYFTSEFGNDTDYIKGELLADSYNGAVFDRSLYINGITLVVAGAVGGQSAVPDEWAKKTARAIELMMDSSDAGVNKAYQRRLIQTLAGTIGPHKGRPTIQRIAYGGGSSYNPNFLTDNGAAQYAGYENLLNRTVHNDMVWYKNTSGPDPSESDRDIEEIMEHLFHTIHNFGIPGAVPNSETECPMETLAYILEENPSFAWQSTELHLAMKEAIDANLYDPSGYATDWNTDPEAAVVAYKEYTYLVNWSMWNMSQFWEGGSLSPEWADALKTQSGMAANNPLGYALFNDYFDPVLTKPNFTTLQNIFQDNDAGVSGYTSNVGQLGKNGSGNPPMGYFGDFNLDDTVKSNFLGEYVDIVAIEAGDVAAGNAGHEDHPDFSEIDDANTSRFVPMDWSTVSSALSSARNNQVTNNNTNWFSSHAIGVLSAAGGKHCGWGKKSSLRVMYLTDGTSNAYYGALQWHISKAVNPSTGVRNATVVTGAWGYVGVDHEKFYIIDDINQIVAYQEDGTSTTINRGDAQPATWNITMTASGSSAYVVTGEDRVYEGTAASSGVNNRAIACNPGDTVIIDNQASGGHPLYIRQGGSNVAGVTGQGTGTVTFTMPDATTTYDYVCDYHSSMTSTISCTKTTSSWQGDYRAFANNLIIPRVINDPADSTDKWMVSIPDQTRASFFDTIMSQYNNYNGIYHFDSAGNNAHIGVSPTDPRFNSTVRIDSGASYVLNTIDGDGRNQFTSATQGAQASYYPLRAEKAGGDNQFTIAACQQDDTNRLMDDYSSRGPLIDFAAYGAYTWTSYPTTTFQDGKWGYFSGTSCAGPVAAGCATVFLENYFTQRGVYPSIAKLKELMVQSAKETLIGEGMEGIDFSNVAGSRANPPAIYPAGNVASTKLYSSSNVNRVSDNDYQNGGADLTELYGTPPLRVHIPWHIRMGTGKYIAGGSEQTTFKRRPTTGKAWPRQKVSFTS